jgi:hypothetical protein
MTHRLRRLALIAVGVLTATSGIVALGAVPAAAAAPVVLYEVPQI